MTDDPHGDQPIEDGGVPIDAARAVVVLVHGRGARASEMLGLANEIGRDDVAYLAPQAHRGTWYPQAFTAPIESNEPHLSSALATLDRVVEDAESTGVPHTRIVLLGFSQGACLATEYAARNARQYGGVVGLSGGLVGPEGTPRAYNGSMEETPVFLGCGDRDLHIPVERVHETANVFESLEADVECRIYEGVGHTVLADELEYTRDLIGDVAADS